jgi:hypothetical protein
MKQNVPTPPKDVPADNPEGTMERFREGLRRVLAIHKAAILPRQTRSHQFTSDNELIPLERERSPEIQKRYRR